MKKVMIILLFTSAVAPLYANAVDSLWYWVSVPNDPKTGYFQEEVLPNRVGYIETHTINSSELRTALSNTFMDTMEETKDSARCSGELNIAISRLREFDLNNEIYIPCLDVRCSVETDGPNLKTIDSRKILLIKIEEDAEQCLEREEKELKEVKIEKERIKAEKKRLREVQQAVEDCDLKFFNEEMTSRERMQTYNERLACNKKDGIVAGIQTSQSKEAQEIDKNKMLKQIQDLLELIVKLKAQLIAQQNGI